MSTETVTSVNEPATNEHNADRAAGGRFQKGNPGGPGNPYGGGMSPLRQKVIERITEEQLDAIIDRVIKMATEGHWQAMKWVLANVFGKAPTVSELAMLDRMIAAEERAAETPPASPEPEAAPTGNGVFSDSSQSPVADAEKPAEAPTANGVFSPAAPIANGDFAPRNRKERRALKKAQRIAARKGFLKAG